MAGETHTLVPEHRRLSSAGDTREAVTTPLKACQLVFDRWGISNPLPRSRDNAALVLDIYEGVYALVRNPVNERAWIRIPRADLGNRSLLDLLCGGTRDELMRAKIFVDYANGR